MERQNMNYEAELLRQEINSNIHTVKSFAWFLLAMFVIWVLTIIDFFQVSKWGVSICFALVFVFFIPTFSIYQKGDLSKWWHKYFFLSVVCILCMGITSILSFHAVFLYVMPLIFSIQYRQKRVLWFTYFLNSICLLISMLISFYYGLCDLNLLLQSQHNRIYYLNLINEQSQFIPFNENIILIIIAFGVFPRSLILFIFTVIMQYAIVSGNDDAYMIAQLTFQKEMDVNTKVYNKNKFEEMKEKYYPRISHVGVIFFDINNLKLINDAYGHDVGDLAIECLANAAKKFSTDYCRVYRVGGDEFVMIFDMPRDGEVDSVHQSINEIIAQERINNKIRISSAGGVSYGTGKEIDKVIKEADEKMYLDKRHQKESGAGRFEHT